MNILPRTSAFPVARSGRLSAVPWRPFAAFVTAFAVLGGVQLASANCTIRSGNVERTPDADFTDHGNGTMTHIRTNLMWKKCLEGRTYSGGTCTGTTRTYTWPVALRRAVSDTTGGYSDWRLPSRIELLSIVETACSTPTINTFRFPFIPGSGQFWTSTHTGPNTPDSVWSVRFSNGASLFATKGTPTYVLLVRAGNTANDSWRGAAPSEPAAFYFAPKTVLAGATETSNIVTMSGLTASRNVSIVGGLYRVNGGSWVSSGTIANGNTLQLQVSAPNTVPATVSATVDVNGRTATFLVSTAAVIEPDTAPDAFSFTDQTGVFPATLTESNGITVSGINTPADIAVTGGEYQKNGGAWTSTAGTVDNGDIVKVRHSSSASYTTTVNTVLTIGGVADTFSTTTAALDTTPNAFTFTDLTGVVRSTLTSSAAITIGGINGAANISVSAGEYEKNGSGTWTSGAGTVVNGDTVKVRHTSSANYNTVVNTVLTVGGVSDTFSTTTEVSDTVPDAFVFTDQSSVALATQIESAPITVAGINNTANISVTGGQYKIGAAGSYTSIAGTVTNGQQVYVRHTSSGSFSTAVDTVLTIGGISDTFTSTTLAADTTPDAFSFTDQVGVVRSSLRTSSAITVAGINSAASISVSGGTYSINGGGYTSVAGTVNNGDTVTVQHTASGSYSTTVNTVLTIGGVSDTFSSLTEAAPGDSVPNAFTFVDQTGVALQTTVTSAAITVTGIDTASIITITGGEYQINGGTWTSSSGTVTVNQTVAVRHTSSAGFSTATNTVLTIGGVTDTFTSTTLAADTTPNAFTFTDQTNVALSTLTESAPITVAGINTGAAISVAGGEYKIGAGGTYTATAGTVSNGDLVYVRHTSSGSFGTATNTTLTIGGVSDIFTTTTLAADTTPNAFTFIDQTNVAVSTLTESAAITVTGINTAASIGVSGAAGSEYQINGGSWVSAGGTVNNNDTVKVRHTSSASNSTAVNTTLTIGGVSDIFSTTTVAPACGLSNWTPVTYSNTSAPKTSNFQHPTVVTLTNICAGTTITISSVATGGRGGTSGRIRYSINGGAIVTTAGTLNPGDVLRLHFVQENRDDTYVGTVTIGGTAKTWQHTGT